MEVYDVNEQGVVTPHEPVPAAEQYPWVDENGVEHNDLIKHYREGGGKIICAETDEVYDDGAIDLYPCDLHYYELEEYDDDLQHEVEENQGTD